MSWRDLLRALDEEAAREVDEVRATAARDAERVLEEARRDAASRRDAALAAVKAEADAARRRAMAQVQRDGARDLLGARREILEEVRTEALDRLRGEDGRSLTLIADMIAGEVGDAPSTWIADPDRMGTVREHLAREHPALLERARLREAATPRGGIEVQVGRRTLDATAAARLERIWPDAEPRLARILFGGGS